jgi:hypothetical protein
LKRRREPATLSSMKATIEIPDDLYRRLEAKRPNKAARSTP